MGRFFSGIPLLFQLILTFIVLFGIYMIYALLDVIEIDMISGIGFIIFQPILAFIITSLTILACLIVGLPIRLVSRIKNFWLSKPLIPLAGIVLGLLLMLSSYNSNFTEFKEVELDLQKVQHEIPNTVMSITGWFLTAFSLLHFCPGALIGELESKREK